LIRVATKSDPKNTSEVLFLMSEATLFVFYSPGANYDSCWTHDLPEGWWFVGSGQTKTQNYPRESQFNGPSGNINSTRESLTKKYETLQANNVIARFKISSSYSP